MIAYMLYFPLQGWFLLSLSCVPCSQAQPTQPWGICPMELVPCFCGLDITPCVGT